MQFSAMQPAANDGRRDGGALGHRTRYSTVSVVVVRAAEVSSPWKAQFRRALRPMRLVPQVP